MEQLDQSASPLFTPEEARVLACLMEKQLTTPNNYPLTIHSLMLACNQKSSREPIMTLTEGEVGRMVNQLADRGFTSIEYGERANRVYHKMRGKLRLDPKQQAVMNVLMLREPQTANEIKQRTERMAEFSGIDEIVAVLEEFMTRVVPLAVRFPAATGRREDRYSHTLCGAVTLPDTEQAEVRGERSGAATARIDALEQRIALLEARLSALENPAIPAEARPGSP
ncbi:MAG: YceH family protein [Thiotrichales bacterium]